MADRRSQATKDAGKPPSTTQTTKEKAETRRQEERQTSSSQYAYDEGGEVTYREKKYFTRESRQEVKDFLKQNPAESYKIYDTQGKLLKETSGRYAYPDILKFSLAGAVSVSPYSKQDPNKQYVALGAGN